MIAGDVQYLISLRDQFSGKLAKINKHTGELDQKMQGLSGTMKKFAGIAAGAFGLYSAMEFLKGSKEAYDNLEKAVTRVNTVLASTKGAAGISGEEIERQAKTLSKSITQGRAEILDAQGMLLSFTGIKGPIFERTTKSVSDFATFYKTDMTSAALAIGKAMNNPAQGMNRLQRMGVAFTDKQKESIKHLQSQGKLMEAQLVIVKELETEFGGQAAAFAGTDEGKVIMAKKKLSETKLEIGKLISELEVALIPAFNKVAEKMSQFAHWISQNKETLITLGKVILKVVAGLLVFKIAIMAIKGYMAIATIATNIYRVSNVMMERGVMSAVKSLGSLKMALAGIGVGLLIIGFTLLIEKLIKSANKLNEFNDKLKDAKKASEDIQKLNISFENRGLYNLPQKQLLLESLNEQATSISQAYADATGEFNKFKSYIERNDVDLTQSIGDQNKFVALQKTMDTYKSSLKKVNDMVNMLKKENPGIEKAMTGNIEGGDQINKIESAAPKVFNTYITKMVGIETLETNNVHESNSELGRAVLELLVGAANDAQITANI